MHSPSAAIAPGVHVLSYGEGATGVPGLQGGARARSPLVLAMSLQRVYHVRILPRAELLFTRHVESLRRIL